MSYDQNPYGDQHRGGDRHRARDSRAGGYDLYQRASGEGYRGQQPSSDGRGRTGHYGAGAGTRGHASDQRAPRGDAYARDHRAGGYSAGAASSRAGGPYRKRGASRGGRSAASHQHGHYQDTPQLGGGDRRRASGSYARQGAGNRYSTPAGGHSSSHSHGQSGHQPANGRGGAPKIGMPRLATSAFSTHGRGGMPAGGGRRVDFAGARPAIIGIACIAICAIVGILLWSNRKVDIKLNGEDFSVRVNSTCEQVISAAELSPKAGNLVSVSGKDLEDGAGYAFTATLGGNELSPEDAEAYRVAAGDELEIADGGDRMEDYDVQVVQESPQLEMGGDAWGNITYVSQWPKPGSYEMRTGKRSGETARGDTLEETQNAIITVHQIAPDDGRKLVALTFDDGPAEKYTETYLDILDKYNIHATFYNLGQNIEEYPDIAKKVVDQGSEIQSHTYQHAQLTTLDASALQNEFSKTFQGIKDNAGIDTTAFRPPYGAFNENSWLKSGGLASVSVLWNQDSLDWKRPGADAIVQNSLKGITSGSIILMHDGGGNRDQDVEALPTIIETLQGEGYEFVTVTELMKSDSSIPEDIASGNATMPEGCVWPTEIKGAGTDAKTAATTAAAGGDGSGKD